MEVFVARQPIFDHQQKVYGYELLYRSRNNDNYDETNGDRASLKVIENFLFITGIEKLTGGKRAFINFTKNLLLEGIAFKLPPKFLVIEILEDVDPNEEIITVCHELKRSGYLLALDDFVLKENGSNPLLNLIDILKVDIQLSSEDEVEATTQKAKEKRIKLLAEKTETLSEFEKAKKLGYNYFQGYFFSKPKIIARKDIPASKIAQLELLQEINRPELDLEKLEKIVKKDTSLTFKLLKYINSAFFGLYQPVTSIKKALIMVGESELRKWGSLIILTSLSKDKPAEVLITSLIRAKFCELLASESRLKDKSSELFLLGMFSLLDVLVGRPMEEILQEIPLPSEVSLALLGEKNCYRQIFEIVLGYERSEWKSISPAIAQLSLPEEKIPEFYLLSIEWVEGSLRLVR